MAISYFMKYFNYLSLSLFLFSCASGTSMFAVDPNSVEDEDKLVIDREQCYEIAATIEMDGEVAGKAVGGALLGGAGVAGAAALAFGAVFPPAIPFIIAGGAAGGSLWGKSASDSEKKFRNNIMKQCLEKRGYTVFTAE